ncbi:PD-(D/E)XK nuclease family protein [Iamia majanohamensis]|uniref:PD-(D/E)XK nuclease family protein n=1 Tax=Iamia majanohamensis TaxID=467976 RepID=A0AAE9Y656_9ACTN|nr:PD-(D/E)XK nuclease family protein [Iamia majanohamensis]WCO67610.1 PD-(D/E)XK nuclease family protein [Iamia majanohamensis]
MPPIDLHVVGHGAPAAQALRDVVAAAKSREALAPVTVVVASNHVGVTVRRQLARGACGPVSPTGRGLAGASFLTTYRLAELLGANVLAGQGRRPVSVPVLAAAVRRVLAAEPGVFGAVAAHPATEAALVASYRELRDLPDAALTALARTGPRAADVVRVHRAVRRALVAGWSDEEDLMAAAAGRVADDPDAATELGTVVVHLPQRLSLHAAALLRAVAAVTPTHVVAGTTGRAEADAEVVASLERLGLGRPEPDADPALPVGPDRTVVVTTSDADDEVRAVVRRIVAALRDGTPLDRVAVLHPGTEPYARLLHEHLSAAGIPYNGPSSVPLAARAAGRALTGLLALPDGGWTRHALLAWLTGAPVLHEGHRPPLARWERLSRDAGVVGGRAQWDARLAARADDLEAAAAAIEAEGGSEERAARRRRGAEDTRALRTFVLDLVDDVEAAATTPRTWTEHARWLRRLLDRLLGAAGRRQGWPDEERRAAERVELAVDRLGALSSVEPGPVALDVVVRTLEVELEGDLGRVGRFGEGVLVGSLAMGVGLDLDLVVVVGMAEGLVPSPPRDDSLLPDRERQAVGGALPLRRDGVGRQQRELLATLASASRHVLSHPRGDLRRSSERVPSRWLLDAASQMAGARLWARDLAAHEADWLVHVQSFDHGLRHLEVPATAQEHRLRALLADGATSRSLEVVDRLGDPALSAGAALVRGRSSHRLTRFDGRLPAGAVASPADPGAARTASPTSLERWARCPFDYFVRSVLGVQEVENPEDALSITALDRGSLVHDVLERFVREVLARPAAEQPSPGDRWSPADRARLRALGEEACDHYEALGRTGRRVMWNRDRAEILRELDQTLTFEEEVRQVEGSRPVAAELAFGGADEGPPVALPLPDGREVRFRGMADRIDRTDAGGLLVVDYKTGSDRSYGGLSEDDPDQGGTRLQLAVYGAAARAVEAEPDAPVKAEYWFVSRKGSFRRKGYSLTPEVEARISETLGLIVAGIEDGLFPAHPTDQVGMPFNPCASCDPDFLGVADMRRTWAAMSDEDPALAGYLALIDPDRRAPGDEEDPDGA